MKKNMDQVERSRWIRPQLWKFLVEVVDSAVEEQKSRDSLGEDLIAFVQQCGESLPSVDFINSAANL